LQRLSSLNFLPSLHYYSYKQLILIVYIQDVQLASCDFSQIVQYLTNGSYPEGTTKDLKRRIRGRAKIFRFHLLNY